MSEAPTLPPGYLGPVTEARFEAVFSRGAVVDRRAAADLIGVDPKTLDDLVEAGRIRAVPKGAHRGYTERALRTYLLTLWAQECTPPTPKPRPRSAPNLKVVPFSERRRKR